MGSAGDFQMRLLEMHLMGMLATDHYSGAIGGPVEEPAGLVDGKVGAAVANGGPKAIMPVGSMDSIAPVVVHGIGHVGGVVAGAAHPGRSQFCVDLPNTGGGGGGRFASGHNDGFDGAIALPGGEPLAAEVNF